MKMYILLLILSLFSIKVYGQKEECKTHQRYVRMIKKTIQEIDKGDNNHKVKALNNLKFLCLSNKSKIESCDNTLRIYLTDLLEKHGYFSLESFHGVSNFDVIDLYISPAFILSDYYQNGAEFGSVWNRQSYDMMLKRPDLLISYLESFISPEERMSKYRILSVWRLPFDLFEEYKYKNELLAGYQPH